MENITRTNRIYQSTGTKQKYEQRSRVHLET
jgi:hypothetical protein